MYNIYVVTYYGLQLQESLRTYGICRLILIHRNTPQSLNRWSFWEACTIHNLGWGHLTLLSPKWHKTKSWKDQMVIARFRDMVNTSAWKGFNMFPEESYGHRIYVYLLSIWNSLEAIVDANGEKPDIHTHTQEDESTFVACIFTLSICLLCTNSRLQVIKKTKVKSCICNMIKHA